jgi:hypothetical protein
MNADDDWPFDQPPNCAVFTTHRIMNRLEPILAVYHDADDLGWQFHGESSSSIKDSKVLALEEIVRLDPTVIEVADLPPGWYATREAVGEPWTCQLNPRVL